MSDVHFSGRKCKRVPVLTAIFDVKQCKGQPKDFIMLSPSWSCTSYRITIIDAYNHFAIRNRLFCSSSLGLVTLISMGGIQDGSTVIKVCRNHACTIHQSSRPMTSCAIHQYIYICFVLLHQRHRFHRLVST